MTTFQSTSTPSSALGGVHPSSTFIKPFLSKQAADAYVASVKDGVQDTDTHYLEATRFRSIRGPWKVFVRVCPNTNRRS